MMFCVPPCINERVAGLVMVLGPSQGAGWRTKAGLLPSAHVPSYQKAQQPLAAILFVL